MSKPPLQLNPKDRRLQNRIRENTDVVAAYLETGSVVEAAAAGGVSEGRSKRVVYSTPVVALLVDAFQQAGITAELVAERIFEGISAETVNVVVLGEGKVQEFREPNWAVRYKFIKLALDQEGKWMDRQIKVAEKIGRQMGKQISTMTADELEAVIAERIASKAR